MSDLVFDTDSIADLIFDIDAPASFCEDILRSSISSPNVDISFTSTEILLNSSIFYFIVLILSVIEIVSTGFLPFLYFKF